MKTIIKIIPAIFPVIAQAQDLPNILVYLADDHGAEHSQPYGFDYVKTPNLMQLSSEGLVFDNAFVASPASGPSRAALMSGLMPARNGAEENHTSPSEDSQIMIKLLQENGYEVVAFGKVAHSIKQSQMCGFDKFLFKGVKNEQLPSLVQKYLNNRTSDKPLCIMVGDRRPHVSWTAEMDYNPSEAPLPSNIYDTPEAREHFSRYLTDITSLDASLGKIQKIVGEHFKGEDIMTVYTADHGAQWPLAKWNLYDRGIRVPMIIKWKNHIPEGVRTNAMVSWIDLLPTLIDVTGGSVPSTIDGKSFANILIDSEKSHRKELYTAHTADGTMNLYPMRSIRTERYKYIENLWSDCYHSNHSDIKRKDGAGAFWDSWDEAAKKDPEAAEFILRYYQRPPEELFDLEVDPLEQNNLADNPDYKNILIELKAKLAQWRQSQGDEIPNLPDTRYPLSGPTPYEVNQAINN